MRSKKIVVLLDGGLGSEVDRRLGITRNLDSWCALFHDTHESLVRQVHEDFAEAGAQVITANTYAMLKYLLGCTDRDVVESVGRAVRLARASGASVVAGSLSAHKSHDHPRSEVLASVQLLANSLLAAKVDIIAVEMIQAMDLGTEMVRSAASTGLPLLLGFSVRRVGGRLVLKEDHARFDEVCVASVLQAVSDAETIRAVGVMHTDSSLLRDALRVISNAWHGPLMAYPENGVFIDNVWRSDASSEEAIVDGLVQLTSEFTDLRVLGGCCGLGPDFIRRLHARLDIDVSPKCLCSGKHSLRRSPSASERSSGRS
jgi:S-methylmethionine-dependent homocysteine/selenocysteine methylase